MRALGVELGAQVTVADAALPPGAHTVVFDFDATSPLGGTLTISVDGETIASGEVAQRPRMVAGNGETFDIVRNHQVDRPFIVPVLRPGV